MIEYLRKAYQGKRVFVTGHTGFKGSWLLLMLEELGAEVKGYALEPKHENDLFNLIDGSNRCEHVVADIRNKEQLNLEIQVWVGLGHPTRVSKYQTETVIFNK